MKNNSTTTTRFLKFSLAAVVALCVLIFACLTIYSDKETKKTIEEVGTIYMTGMSERITMHFDTAIDYRLSQLENVVENCPPGLYSNETLWERLAASAEAREFDYLSLYSAEIGEERFYGGNVAVSDPAPFPP